MYSVLIADDESIIRQGLLRFIDWEALGFSVVDEAETGEAALSKMLRLRPDVVLMDIRMPGIPGLEAVRQARNAGFDGKIIILSGYSDFKYAQEAMQWGVEYYLTKPVDEEELIAILTKMKRQFDERSVTTDAVAQYQKRAHDAVILDLLSGQLDASFLQLPDFHLEASSYQVVFSERFAPTDANADRPCYQFADLMNAINDDTTTYDLVTTGHYEVLLLKGDFAISRFMRLLSHYTPGATPQRNSLLDSFFITCGECVSSFEKIPRSYQDAQLLMQRRFFCAPGQHTIEYTLNTPPSSENPPLTSLEDAFLDSYSKRLLDDAQAFNRPLLEGAIADLQADLIATQCSAEAARLFLIDLFLQIKEQMGRIYSDITIPFPGNANIIRSINDASYLYEIMEFYSAQFTIIMNAIDNFDRKSILDNVIHYINRNYANNNLTLDSIAPLFGYNNSYLGKILNRHIGQSFNNYLDTIRINHAKELLRSTDMKIYTIAEKVGYRTVDYFHIKFKKLEGMTPAEYRRIHRTS